MAKIRSMGTLMIEMVESSSDLFGSLDPPTLARGRDATENEA